MQTPNETRNGAVSLLFFGAFLGLIVGATWGFYWGHSNNDSISAADITILSSAGQGIGSIGTMLVTIIISSMVYRYTKRKDRLDLYLRRWSVQQDVNISTISSDSNLIAAEKSIYGPDASVDIMEGRIYYNLFMRINMLQMMYFGYKEGLINKSELYVSSIHTAKLLYNSKELVSYLLRERGYTPDFLAHLHEIIDKAGSPAPRRKYGPDEAAAPNE